MLILDPENEPSAHPRRFLLDALSEFPRFLFGNDRIFPSAVQGLFPFGGASMTKGEPLVTERLRATAANQEWLRDT